MIKKELMITLKSDLCMGSGYSYAGIISSDICYDKYGIPYIPAKRLKGTLREAAELIGVPDADIKRLFGERSGSVFDENGKYRQQGIRLNNAYINNYEKIYNALNHLDEDYRTYITPQSILEQFTVVKAQTKIDSASGVAKDQSLRFTRAVKQYSPLEEGKEMQFIAEVELAGFHEDDEKKMYECFQNIVKAMRNIGMNRNRGMGSVKCTLRDSVNTDHSMVNLDWNEDDEEIYKLTYRIRNVAPLVLNADNNYETEKYISGQVAMGYFAAAYLKEGNPADEVFADLFLRNQVIFSGLYPCEGKKVFYPAPSFIKCLKRTKKYVNVSKNTDDIISESANNNELTKYLPEDGNQPKRLNGKFVYIERVNNDKETKKAEDLPEQKCSNYKIQVKEVQTDIVYHHTKKSEEGDFLYSQEVIRPQQTFVGTIIGKGKHIRKINELLSKGTLKFGRSKTSQYGTCVLENEPSIERMNPKKQIYSAGTEILVTLQSDGIFMNESGYTVRCDEVKDKIAKTLGIEARVKECAKNENESTVNNENPEYLEIESRKLIGFYSKWNLKRQAIPVVCAGSTFSFILDSDLEIKDIDLYVGERNGDGYGKIKIYENDGGYCVTELNNSVTREKENNSLPVEMYDAVTLCKRILLKEMRERLNNAALMIDEPIKNSTTVGRLTMMLVESINKNPDNMKNAYIDFSKRISNIKDKDKREEIENIKKNYICEKEELDFASLNYVSKIDELIKAYKKLQTLEASKEDNEEQTNSMNHELECEVENMWGEYLMSFLSYKKLKLRGEI